MADPFAQCWYLSGATAVGKTSVGIALAEMLSAEIVSLDSMAIYRGMDIGTATPTKEQRAVVPHHMVDIVDPVDEYSVAQYMEAAASIVTEIRDRGREVLFVGGTPLYLKGILRGLSSGPPADWELRKQLESDVRRLGTQPLHSLLERVDPLAAARIHPHDTRRLVRALEVFRATGEPISHSQLQFEEGRPSESCRVFVLRRTRAEQHQRINQRAEKMISDGLVEEVRSLTSAGRQLGRTASQAVGYHEIQDFLADRMPMDEALSRIKARTRRFAKRQETWFRSLSESSFVDLEGEVDATQIAERIAAEGYAR